MSREGLCEGLCEAVSGHFSGWQPLNLDAPVLYFLPKPVAVDVDVSELGVELEAVPCEDANSLLVITVNN